MPYLRTDISADLASTPELHLLGAILHQAVKDLRSGRADIREEARAFLSNKAHLAYWESILGLRDGVLLQRMRNVLHAGR
jgi:hypothetical protein